MPTSAPAVFVARSPLPALPPPTAHTGATGWLRANLFSSPSNITLTVLCVALIAWVVPPFLNFLLIDAVWSGADRDACLATPANPEIGACWAFVRERFNFFVYGFYPIGQRWRVDIFFAALALGIAWMMWLDAPRRSLGGVYFFIFLPVASYFLLFGGRLDAFTIGWIAAALSALASDLGSYGSGPVGLLLQLVGLFIAVISSPITLLSYLFHATDVPVLADLAATALFCAAAAWWIFGRRAAVHTVIVFVGVAAAIRLLGLDTTGLVQVETAQWGGLLVTLVVASVGIVTSLPLGIVLALGRRSSMPAVRLLSVIFIEFVRGVPLITVLFMASVMLPLFVPDTWSPDKLLRALIGVALFSAAYMAEVVRAGLQAIPRGQFEAARALGLNYWKTMSFIVLPQALKITIPNIVNSAVGLFKDTTLVFVVGIFDLLKTVEAARIDPNWATPVTSATGYAFAAMVYFIGCYGMSRYARYVEAKLAQGERR